MDDQQLKEVCNKIYEKHKKALDLIFENRVDSKSQTAAAIRSGLSRERKYAACILFWDLPAAIMKRSWCPGGSSFPPEEVNPAATRKQMTRGTRKDKRGMEKRRKRN